MDIRHSRVLAGSLFILSCLLLAAVSAFLVFFNDTSFNGDSAIVFIVVFYVIPLIVTVFSCFKDYGLACIILLIMGALFVPVILIISIVQDPNIIKTTEDIIQAIIYFVVPLPFGALAVYMRYVYEDADLYAWADKEAEKASMDREFEQKYGVKKMSNGYYIDPNAYGNTEGLKALVARMNSYEYKLLIEYKEQRIRTTTEKIQVGEKINSVNYSGYGSATVDTSPIYSDIEKPYVSVETVKKEMSAESVLDVAKNISLTNYNKECSVIIEHRSGRTIVIAVYNAGVLYR